MSEKLFKTLVVISTVLQRLFAKVRRSIIMKRIFSPSDPGSAGSLGLLVLRLVLGLALAMHGYQKLDHAFSWMGPDAWAPGFLQALSVLAEFGGGIALLLGFLTPLAALLVVANMLVALFAVHIPHGDMLVAVRGSGHGSFDLAALYAAGACCLMLVGPGLYSLDAIIFKRKFVRTSAEVRPRAVAR
jgi:putative oxidoreductase